MKPLANPADKKKAAILGVTVALVFIFVVKNTMGALAGSGPSSPEASTESLGGGAPGAPPPGGPPAVSPGQPIGVIPGVAPEDLIDPPKYAMADTPNPFHRDILGYTGPLDVVRDLNPAILAPPPPRPVRRGSTGLGGTLPNIGGSNPPVLITSHDAPPEPPQVMGVMTGDNPVAVIRVGAQQYVVTKGSKFGHNMRLRSVTDSQVVIEDGGTLHILRVGIRPPSPPTDQQPPPKTTGI